mgnify:CR=1 FL=1
MAVQEESNRLIVAQKLIQKLIFATFSVVVLVFLTLGKREAVIVGAAVLLTLLPLKYEA